jgi:DNA-binding transcriptional LysR family regulator
MYNLEQLKMFVITAESGSFSACAKRLGKVQSAVSQGIANLEIDLGCQLFDRSTRKPSLTTEGIRLLEYAKAVILQNQELQLAAQAIHNQIETHLTLAVDSSSVLPDLIDSIKQFSNLFPTTQFNLITGTSSQVLQWVRDGDADMGLMFANTNLHRGVNLSYIGNLAFYGMCHKDHPLTQLETVSETQLINHRQIIAKDWTTNGTDQFMPLGPNTWFTNNFHEVKALIKSSLGWGYLPKHLVQTELESGEMVALNLSFDHKPWNPPIERIMPKNKPTGPALAWLSEELTKVIGES